MAYWEKFENEVSHLFKLLGWNVEEEHLVGSKKVDLLITKQVIANRSYTMAVECKSYQKKLSKKEVEGIYASYAPLLHRNEIDELFIVTINGVSPAAYTYCIDNKSVSHVTFSQLESSILNFDLYIQGIFSEYNRKGIDQYYIDQLVSRINLDENELLFSSYFDEWLEMEDSDPIAVLAGYGMGKSTLSLRLAFNQAKRFQKNQELRIPIVIKLGGLANEQSLEGLLGKHLTAENKVSNYNFDIFMELNKRGRFVIFLDGFDEMKKSMSWDDMKYNFQELFRLFCGNSKVVIFGRPSVFLSNDEYVEIINGKKCVGNVFHRIPNSPVFEELKILPFSKPQVEVYIDGYSNYIHEESNIEFPQSRIDKLKKAIREKNNSLISNLANRPVHLRMLVELLPYIDYDYTDSRVSTLYSEFVDYVTRRELEKRARSRFSTYKRRSFMQSFAWWVWTNGLGEGVNFNRIDKSLFSKYIGEDDDFGDIARDLLSGSILDTKNGSAFYFPHRSFLEFLVAEQLAKEIRSGRAIHWDLLFTPEIGLYLKDILCEDGDFSAFTSLIFNYRGVIDAWVIDLIVDFSDHPQDLFQSEGVSPWPMVAFSNGVRRGKWKNIKNNELRDIFVHKVFRYDVRNEEIEQYKNIFQFVYLRVVNQLNQRRINIDKEAYSFLVNKRNSGITGEIRIEGANIVSGLSENYCFVTNWKNFINTNDFMYNKQRLRLRR
jgi:hypothetical protein